MAMLQLAERLRLKEIANDVFQNIHEPWTWPFNTDVIPGGLLMSECAMAAYNTISEDFALDSLQAHFLAGPKAKVPMVFRVTRLSNGRRFAVRSILLEQNGVPLLHATASFVNKSPWTAPSMVSTSTRRTAQDVDEIILDDLDHGLGPSGPFMKFQRLPLLLKDDSNSLEGSISTSVAQITPRVQDSSDIKSHTLGIINLSDYHVMDCPLQLSGITLGLYEIGDKTRTPTKANLKFGTSLNHTIHFHVHDGFRADDLTYLESETLWVKDGRAMVSTKIFSKDGLLVATCSQEAFHVLLHDVAKSVSKL